MTAVEKIKREIKKLPDKNIKEIDQFIHSIQQKKAVKIKLPSFHLHGQYDAVSVRDKAYE